MAYPETTVEVLPKVHSSEGNEKLFNKNSRSRVRRTSPTPGCGLLSF